MTRLTRGDAEDRDAAWSPDGREAAFPRNGEIWVIGAAGSSPHRLAKSSTLSYSEPDCSPDGRRIAFVGGDANISEIWVMRADGTGKTRLTTDPPSIADLLDDEPDGRWIAFERSYGVGCCARNGIWVMDAEGRNAYQVTVDDDTDPKWQPRLRTGG